MLSPDASHVTASLWTGLFFTVPLCWLRYAGDSLVPPTRIRLLLSLLLGLSLASPLVSAQGYVFFRGRVVREDGTVADRPVTLQRVCQGLPQPIREATASRRNGEYVVRLFLSHFGQVFSGWGLSEMLPCSLEASASGYVSSRIDLTDRHVTLNPRLPDIVLTPKSQSAALDLRPPAGVPRAASRNWELAVERLIARNWDGAETPLRAVVQAAPGFAPAWSALGNVCLRQGKLEEARRVLQRAVELDSSQLISYHMLAQVQFDLKDWPAAVATTEKLLAADTKHIYLEAYLVNAAALYQLREFDQALQRVDEAARLDRLRELKRTLYLRGLILEAKGDYPSAEMSLRGYLAQNPRAKEAADVTQRIASLGKGQPSGLSADMSSLDLSLAATGEARVPGGIKAFSLVAQIDPAPSPHDFFLSYARAITAGRPDQPNRTKEAREEIAAFISTVAALERLGERTATGTLIQLSTSSDAALRATRAILSELGWKLVEQGDGFSIETATLPIERYRQRALAAFGVDELDLRNALRDRRNFTFEIPNETARLVGGAAWSMLLKGVPEAAGGPPEIFIRDWRFAHVYSGLGAMNLDSASALVAAAGLANLIVKYSHLTSSYAEALVIGANRVLVPGGPPAEPVWASLAGASPRAVAPFLRGLLEKDQGRLLAFYHALAHADASHQRFFTRDAARAQAFYRWYRDSAPPAGSFGVAASWQQQILQSLPIDASGNVLFPGSREVWGNAADSDDNILLAPAPLEALAAIIQLEQRRGAPLSPPAVRLLVRHFTEWRSLFGYFDHLPGLGEPAFRALEQFAAVAAAAPMPRRNQLLGEWHSLVQLIVLGSQAGSLSAAQADHAFQQACDALRAPDPHLAALAALRAILGGPAVLDEALAGQLLRLSGARREAFDEIKRLQDVPSLASLGPSPTATATLEALSGAVYAAMLDPGFLLVAADRQLLRKHRFVSADSRAPLFLDSSLHRSNGPDGSNFEGGFASFHDAARPLRDRVAASRSPRAEPAANPGGPSPVAPPVVSAAPPPADAAPADGGDVIFRARGRIVEVYATVTDSKGRYVDNLTSTQFVILEDGVAKPVAAFESYLAGVSVALVFDTTGSMSHTLPTLKGAALELLSELRNVDSVAVYSFDETVTPVLPITADKEAAKRAILKLHASGTTALYDALVKVNRDLASRAGKKVIVVFTDGADNASMISSKLAIESARERGIPIYTIAEGEAIVHAQLVAELDNISRSTGGTPFLVRHLSEIGGVFQKISQDLLHGYLVGFQPSTGDARTWRKIEVVLGGAKALKVRARDGFYVE